ncbi:hypothetical protein MIZ01_1889 [Sideroxyarcus emersonii]|uniref:Uncharacterized protein n=2 Tax=Sideroxyarcus emersonii TaxID=2764705 RepID=A0AAN2BZD1_9PROT|nr:hypothetical protein MIZ01_1889 [Sideroxyarcus emersonii]
MKESPPVMNSSTEIPSPSCSTGLTTVEYSTLSATEQEKILHLQQAILESIARGGEITALINQLCKLVEQLLPNSVASVMLLDESRELLNVYAAPSVPPEGISQLNGLRPGPGGGSCGNAVFRKEPQFVENTFTDPRWQNLRQLAYDFNLCACWSMPIFSAQGAVIGSFALSSFEHRLPSDFHRKLLEIGASIVGIALERSKTQESLRLFEKVYDGSEEGFMITDLNQRILSVNRAFCKVLGYEPEEVIGETPRKLASGHHDKSFYSAMWESIEVFGHWRGEIWNRRKNGEVFPEWLSVSSVKDATGKTTHYVGIFSDISERKNAEAQIQYLSSHDPLTDLPNRILFKDRLENALAHAERTQSRVALLTVDLDNFKLFNDSLGHAVGDTLLRNVAARLKNCVRATDTVSRQGGDEFLIALAELPDSDTVGTIAQHILDQVAKPLDMEGSPLSLSCSIGIAVYPDDGESYDILLKKASLALYSAKAAGRNACHFFTEQMNSDSLEHLRIAHNLRHAVQRNEFVLHYQPQIDLDSGQLIGAEALIRWNHPTEGLIPPARFISVAEQTGLIVQMGEWALNEACKQAVSWQRSDRPALMVAVNVSAVQFRRGNMEQSIRKAIAASGLDPTLLEIELTESVLLHDMEYMLGLIKRLKEIGITLAIDDFGTGYSSLAYLKRFKADRLKIDQSFVRDMADDPDDAAIVHAIIQMGRTLNLRTIAEGVETAKQVDLLRSLECNEVQGYHFARPMPADAFSRFLDTYRPAVRE